MGNAVVQFLRDCEGVCDHVAGLCFDTSCNSGTHTGSFIVIHEAFQKHILFLVGGHNILEIIAAAYFDLFFVSNGPITPLFSRLKENWSLVDQTKYNSQDNETTKTSGCGLTASERQ